MLAKISVSYIMVELIVYSLFLLSLPLVINAFFHAFHALKFWQKSNYSFTKLAHHLWWDFELSHRPTIATVFKTLLGLAAGLSLMLGQLTLAGIIAIIGFGYLTNEAITHVQKIFNHKWPKLQPDWRVSWVLSSIVVIVFAVIALIGVSWFALIYEAGRFLVMELFIPGIVLLLMIGLILDLASSVVVMMLIGISAPFSRLIDGIYIAQAAAVIQKYRHQLKIVYITGSQGKTAIRKLLRNVITDDYSVIADIEHPATAAIAARLLLKRLTSHTRVIILELNSFQEGDIRQFGRLALADIGVITSIEESNIGFFGNIDKTLLAKAELLGILAENGVAVLNASDANVRRLIQTHRNVEILYYPDSASEEIIDNDPIVETLKITKKRKAENNRLKFTLQLQASEFEAEIPKDKEDFLPSWLAALAVCIQLGLPAENVAPKLSLFTNILFPYQQLDADNGSKLLIHSAKSTYSSILKSIQHVDNVQAKRKILVTGGLNGFGKYKLSTYKKLGGQINDSFDVLITFDPYLAAAAQKNNTRCQIILVSKTDELLYRIRKISKRLDLIMMHGEFDAELIAELQRN